MGSPTVGSPIVTSVNYEQLNASYTGVSECNGLFFSCHKEGSKCAFPSLVINGVGNCDNFMQWSGENVKIDGTDVLIIYCDSSCHTGKVWNICVNFLWYNAWCLHTYIILVAVIEDKVKRAQRVRGERWKENSCSLPPPLIFPIPLRQGEGTQSLSSLERWKIEEQ